MMNALQKIFDSQRRHFSAGGRLGRLAPLFDATETFFFIPAHVTAGDAHIRDSLDIKRFMSIVILALMPPFFFGIYNAGYHSHAAENLPLSFFPVFLSGLWIVMPLIVVSYAVGLFWEVLFSVLRKHPISEGFLVTGLLFPLTLPPTVPLWQAALGISFGVVIGKEIFGGTGRNILNPALTARAFLFFAYPGNMSGDRIWTAVDGAKHSAVDALSAATPLSVAAVADTPQKMKTLLADADYSFLTLFLGNYPGSIGETSALLVLLGAIILIVTGIASYRIMLGGILGVVLTAGLFNLLATDTSGAWFSLNPCYHLVMGGFAFGIVYMATDPVTAPGMNTSRWVYGLAIGGLTVLIRLLNPAYPEGVMLAILFMNLFSPLLEYLEIKGRLKKRMANV